jgi:hypothetical protein
MWGSRKRRWKEGDGSSKQLKESHNYQKDSFQDQLRSSKPEAMAKNVRLATYHPPYSDFFQNLHHGDEFSMDVVKMVGPVERPVEIHTTALVLDLFLVHAPFDVSLQYAMAIILKRSQDQTFSAPAEWATFIKQVYFGIQTLLPLRC